MAADIDSNIALSRVLLLAPTSRDAEITLSLLTKAAMACVVCGDLNHLVREIKKGAGAVLLSEQVLAADGIEVLLNTLKEQPAWSDLPIVMLMQGGVASGMDARILAALRNVTLVERPAPVRSMLSALQAAIRGRQRQYQIRDQLDTIRVAQDERQILLDSERAARKDAERANRIKDEFLATLSHELRTPLSAIFGWTRIMRLRPGDPAMISEGINVIERNVRLQTQLIEDLFDVSRIISGKIRLDLQPVKIAEIIDATLESVMPSLTDKDIRLEKTIDAAAGFVAGDPGRLQQVLWNLMTNAIKFTPKGGNIHVLGARVQSHVEVTIRDSGEGISAEFLPQLFERFTQADGSTTRRHGGLGLGLSIVRNLVEMHGGKIHAHSPGKDKGATFTVELPISPALGYSKEPVDLRSSVTAVGLTLQVRRLKGIKVLVVDDEPDALDLVRRFLMECEATLSLAASAAEAQSLLLSFKPDVIVSDIGMPIQDGYDFMRAVRRQGLKIPAVALTAFARPEDRLRSIQAGYQMHLTKPVEPAELIAVVANLAGRYESPESS